MSSARNRSFRPEISGLEGRQLLSSAAGHMAVREKAAAHIAPPHAGAMPTLPATPVGRQGFHFAYTIFGGPRSDSAPALAEFQGKTIMAWSDGPTGTLNVATVVGRSPNYRLTSMVSLPGDVSPGRSPALAALNGHLYMAWTEPDGKINVMSSADGVHFANKVTLSDTSFGGPALAAYNNQLFLAFTGTNGELNVESSTDGMKFGDKVTLSQTSQFSPALAAFNGRLYVAWTGTDSRQNFESTADGTSFSDKVILDSTSGAAPGLTTELPAATGQSARLVLGFTNPGDTEITLLDVSGRTTNPNAPIPYLDFTVGQSQSTLNGLALVSPSAGTLDMAWTGYRSSLHHLNFGQVPQWIS